MTYLESANKAFSSGQTENMSPAFIEFKTEGQVIVGKFLSRVEVKSNKNDGTYSQYLFDTDDGLIKFHLGKATDTETGDHFIEDNIYHIEYQGNIKIAGGKTVNKFHIEHILS